MMTTPMTLSQSDHLRDVIRYYNNHCYKLETAIAKNDLENAERFLITMKSFINELSDTTKIITERTQSLTLLLNKKIREKA